MMQKPIRVLCVFSTLGRGGAETMCMNLYRHIDRSRVQFDFVKHTKETGAFENEIKELGGRIYTAPRFKFYNFFSYCQWWRKHFKNHPEHQIVHGHFFTISSVYFEIAHRHNRTTVGHVHASHVDGKFRNWVIRLIEKRTDYCLACSEQSGKWVYPHRKFKVINNAIDAEKFRTDQAKRTAVRKLMGIDDAALVIGTVGNFSPVKNPMGTIAIFDEILKQSPNAKFLWIGDGGLRKQIEAEIKKRHLSENMILTGTRGDVEVILQAMDAFILPSFHEGLPVVTIEAQAAGLKCFVSEAVTREANITGRCTYLDNSDYTQWAKAICSSDLTKVDTYEQICKAGYDIHETAQWLENFYLKIDKKRR